MVTVFGSTTCAFCKVLRQWLDSKGVEYTYRNIDEDEKAKEFIDGAGYRGVPVTVVPGLPLPIEGFNREQLTKALAL